MNETNEKPVSAKPRTRSPAYPSLGLEDAIRKARVIYDEAEQHPIDTAAVSALWDTPITSSGFQLSVSALKQYGLLVDEGKGDDRKFHISDLAHQYFIHEDASPERETAVREAALSPKIHRELWEKYDGKLPLNDSPIRVYLLKGRKDEGKGEPFNKDVVDSFIRQFRSTVAFAGLKASDKMSSADALEDEAGEQTTMDKTSPNRTGTETVAQGIPPLPLPSAAPASTAPGPIIFFPLSGGNAIEIRLRAKLSPADFETVKQLVSLSQASLVDPDKK